MCRAPWGPDAADAPESRRPTAPPSHHRPGFGRTGHALCTVGSLSAPLLSVHCLLSGVWRRLSCLLWVPPLSPACPPPWPAQRAAPRRVGGRARLSSCMRRCWPWTHWCRAAGMGRGRAAGSGPPGRRHAHASASLHASSSPPRGRLGETRGPRTGGFGPRQKLTHLFRACAQGASGHRLGRWGRGCGQAAGAPEGAKGPTASPGAAAKLSLTVCRSPGCPSASALTLGICGRAWVGAALPVDAGSLPAELGPRCADPGMASVGQGLPFAPWLFRVSLWGGRRGRRRLGLGFLPPSLPKLLPLSRVNARKPPLHTHGGLAGALSARAGGQSPGPCWLASVLGS